MDIGHIITLPEFKAAMGEVLRKHEDKLLGAWNTLTEYTDIWGHKSGKEGYIYSELAEELGMKWRHEYAAMYDAVYFKDWCPIAGGGGRQAAFLSLVVEHENNHETSGQEMNRLLSVNASLKALVTYPDNNEKELFAAYAQQIKVVDDILPGYSAQQRHVVIFGDKENGSLVWTYYIYGHGEFRPF